MAEKLSHVGKKFGITEVELKRMADIKVQTFDDLVNAFDDIIIKSFGKKAFLAIHLI